MIWPFKGVKDTYVIEMKQVYSLLAVKSLGHSVETSVNMHMAKIRMPVPPLPLWQKIPLIIKGPLIIIIPLANWMFENDGLLFTAQ